MWETKVVFSCHKRKSSWNISEKRENEHLWNSYVFIGSETRDTSWRKVIVFTCHIHNATTPLPFTPWSLISLPALWRRLPSWRHLLLAATSVPDLCFSVILIFKNHSFTRKAETGRSPICWSILQSSTAAGALPELESAEGNSMQVSSVGDGDPGYRGPSLCFPRVCLYEQLESGVKTRTQTQMS